MKKSIFLTILIFSMGFWSCMPNFFSNSKEKKFSPGDEVSIKNLLDHPKDYEGISVRVSGYISWVGEGVMLFPWIEYDTTRRIEAAIDTEYFIIKESEKVIRIKRAYGYKVLLPDSVFAYKIFEKPRMGNLSDSTLTLISVKKDKEACLPLSLLYPIKLKILGVIWRYTDGKYFLKVVSYSPVIPKSK